MTLRAAPILLVEDDDDDVDVTLLALRRAGFQDVAVARDGVEALDYLLRSGHALPRLVLLDLRMPRLDGFEVLKALRGDRRTAHLPIVVLTASREPRDIEESYSAGANSYVRKTIDMKEFDAMAERIGNYWLQINEVVT